MPEDAKTVRTKSYKKGFLDGEVLAFCAAGSKSAELVCRTCWSAFLTYLSSCCVQTLNTAQREFFLMLVSYQKWWSPQPLIFHVKRQ